jgi:hypothetical protein
MTSDKTPHAKDAPRPTSDHPTPTADDEAQKARARKTSAGGAAREATEERDDNPNN